MLDMIVTSVCGHIIEYKFPQKCKDWAKTPYKELYKCKLEKQPSVQNLDIVKNLHEYAKNADMLILWLDCDREGEAIAFEVIEIVREIKPDIEIKRAHFSALTKQDIFRAITTRLTEPNKNQADAVFARQEIDLRIGASFTRLQSMKFKDVIGANQKQVLSYGPCQFPTLGFVVERFTKVSKFEPEKYWTITIQCLKPQEILEEEAQEEENQEDQEEYGEEVDQENCNADIQQEQNTEELDPSQNQVTDTQLYDNTQAQDTQMHNVEENNDGYENEDDETVESPIQQISVKENLVEQKDNMQYDNKICEKDLNNFSEEFATDEQNSQKDQCQQNIDTTQNKPQISEPTPEPEVKPKRRGFFESKKPKDAIQFDWARYRIFDQQMCEILLENIQDGEVATVTKVISKRKTKIKPIPLNTIDFQKLVSRKLRIGSHKAMEIAEKLYQRGYISYPRTETNIFPAMNLQEIVKDLTKNTTFGGYAKKILSGNLYGTPRKGKQDDKAHPPIHPVKNANKMDLKHDEWRIYEIICKHFLACLSKDATGNETKIEVEIGGETFKTRGLVIVESNWLEIYQPYEKWADNTLPNFQEGDQFTPSLIQMQESQTQPPKLLSEADLISRMDKNGIGTDATIHEHIKTIQDRGYALKQGQHFIPTQLGLNLVNAYDHVGIELFKPNLRSQVERQLKEIEYGNRNKKEVLKECLREMRRIFKTVKSRSEEMQDFLTQQIINPIIQVPSLIKDQSESDSQLQSSNAQMTQLLNNYDVKAEDFFKTPVEIQKKINHEKKFSQDTVFNSDEKTTLADTQFMLCDKCRQNPVYIKMANSGFLFATCAGYPKCKNSQFLPKNVKNLAVTDENCPACTEARENEEVKKLKISFYTSCAQNQEELQQAIQNSQSIYCILGTCDENFQKVKQFCKGIKIPPKKGTFLDELTEEERQAKIEQNQRWFERRRDFKSFGKNNYQKGQQTLGGDKGFVQNGSGRFKKGSHGFENQNGKGMKGQKGGGRKQKGGGCPECGKKRHSAKSDCINNKNRNQIE
eukprot:403373519